MVMTQGGRKSMADTEVQVIKATEGPIVRGRRLVGTPLTLQRKRVAAYVRVSTDGEEQLQSFQSQKQYYQDKISKNKEWAMVGIYADEGITGTKTDKRDEFLRMIEDCMNGQIDVVITKSISRFSRNLVDTLTYTRMLKQKGVTVIFEKENIDTSTMESEMQLSLLSALAQNEVESLSQNVKMGVQYKMARGELMGFNGCLGYDYNPEDKSISVNPAEAETVRLIFDLYIQGYGANTIAKRLTELGKVNKKGIVKWTASLFLGNVLLRVIAGGFINSDNAMISGGNLINNSSFILNITTLGQSYLILISIIVLSVVFASSLILIKKPKEILSKIS